MMQATSKTSIDVPAARSVTVKVPGTTANMGPGFDSFGLALETYNSVTLSCGGKGISRKSPPLPSMVKTTAACFFQGANISPFPFAWKIRGSVPQARGLGSSVTVRLGTLLGLNALAGGRLSRNGLFRLCAELEGHPDNAAPAMFGGFTIARSHGVPIRFPVAPALRFILLIPDFEVPTPAARKVMPESINVTDAAANAADAAVIAAAFATKRYDLLKGSFGDRLHQPYRGKLVPFLEQVIMAGEKAGALGGWLSGSGSTVCCMAANPKTAALVAGAMRREAPKGSKIMICKGDNSGARIVK
jgi:homoserine kinase